MSKLWTCSVQSTGPHNSILAVDSVCGLIAHFRYVTLNKVRTWYAITNFTYFTFNLVCLLVLNCQVCTCFNALVMEGMWLIGMGDLGMFLVTWAPFRFTGDSVPLSESDWVLLRFDPLRLEAIQFLLYNFLFWNLSHFTDYGVYFQRMLLQCTSISLIIEECSRKCSSRSSSSGIKNSQQGSN